MAEREQADLRLAHIDGMHQALEHKVALVRAITLQTQRRQRQGVGGVVGQIEAAGERQRRVVGILKAVDGGTQQAFAFLMVRRISLEATAARQVFRLLTAHAQTHPAADHRSG